MWDNVAEAIDAFERDDFVKVKAWSRCSITGRS